VRFATFPLYPLEPTYERTSLNRRCEIMLHVRIPRTGFRLRNREHCPPLYSLFPSVLLF
jgi:hypothetical protein